MLCPTAFVAWYLCPFTSARFNSTHGRGVLGRGLHQNYLSYLIWGIVIHIFCIYKLCEAVEIVVIELYSKLKVA